MNTLLVRHARVVVTADGARRETADDVIDACGGELTTVDRPRLVERRNRLAREPVAP